MPFRPDSRQGTLPSRPVAAKPRRSSAASQLSALSKERRIRQPAGRYREEIRWLIGEVGNNPIAAITPARSFPAIGPQRISLKVGDTIKQDAHLSDLIWSVPELVSHLSRYYHLRPGDHLVGEIDGLERVVVTIGNPS